jgi:hypothetical protein
MSLDAPDLAADPYADAPVGNPPTPKARLRYLAKLMASARYETGETGPALAERWGLDESTVRHDTAAASTWTQSELGDVSQVRVLVLGMATEAVRMGRRAADPEKGAAVILKAADLIARITGCAPATRQMVALVDGGEDAWTVKPPAEGE